MRSKLFVPGSRPELFAKAFASAADSISFDVEDAVPEDGKVRARAAISEFLRSGSGRASAKIVIVRTNAPDSRHFEEDLRAFARPEVAGGDALQSHALESLAARHEVTRTSRFHSEFRTVLD